MFARPVSGDWLEKELKLIDSNLIFQKYKLFHLLASFKSLIGLVLGFWNTRVRDDIFNTGKTSSEKNPLPSNRKTGKKKHEQTIHDIEN